MNGAIARRRSKYNRSNLIGCEDYICECNEASAPFRRLLQVRVVLLPVSNRRNNSELNNLVAHLAEVSV